MYAQEGKKVFLLMADKVCSQGLGGFKALPSLADGCEFVHKPFFYTRRLIIGGIRGTLPIFFKHDMGLF